MHFLHVKLRRCQLLNCVCRRIECFVLVFFIYIFIGHILDEIKLRWNEFTYDGEFLLAEQMSLHNLCFLFGIE